jgi:hypothetical protein
MSGPQDAGGRKVTALAELPQAIAPPRDLWPDIATRLEPRASGGAGARRAQQLRWLAAAAMVACVAVGVWIGRSSLNGAGTAAHLTAQAPGNAQPGPSLAGLDAPTALDAAYITDPRYRQQRAALLKSLEARIATLPPASRDKVLASLATIRQAKQDLEQALGKDPSNALLQELLVNTYQDEMRVLTDVQQASDPGRGI